MSTQEQAIIGGIVYDIIGESTTEELRACGFLSTLHEWERQGVLRHVLVRRPNGQKTYVANDYGPHPTYGENSRYIKIAPV